MRKIFLCGAAIAVAATPASAIAKPDPKKDKKPPYCVPSSVGYKASGKLVEAAISQTAGADTARRGDDRYSGELTVDVKKANHKGLKGEQTIALTNARVKFHPRKDTDTAPGDRVKVSGKVTKVSKKCTGAFEPTLTAKKVDIKAAKAPKA